MKSVKVTIFLLLLNFLICLNIFNTAFAGTDASDREKLINQELDCVSQALQQNGQITWEDVCSTSHHNDGDEHQQLNNHSPDEFVHEHADYYKNSDEGIKTDEDNQENKRRDLENAEGYENMLSKNTEVSLQISSYAS